jgi:uncharacterized membrane protein
MLMLIIKSFLENGNEVSGFRESNNKLRFFTGLIGGIGLAIIIKALKYYLLSGVV